MAKEAIDISFATIHESDKVAVPVCLRCLRPYDPLQYYCNHCGEAVGQLTPYIPFVSIRFYCSLFERMWRRIWWDADTPLTCRLAHLLLIAFWAPVMLVGLPFLIIAKRRRRG